MHSLSNRSTAFLVQHSRYFGKDVFASLGGKVPIGLVSSNVGGTAVERWSGPDALAHCNQTGVVQQVCTLLFSLLMNVSTIQGLTLSAQMVLSCLFVEFGAVKSVDSTYCTHFAHAGAGLVRRHSVHHTRKLACYTSAKLIRLAGCVTGTGP